MHQRVGHEFIHQGKLSSSDSRCLYSAYIQASFTAYASTCWNVKPAASPSLSCLKMSTSQAQVWQCMRHNTKMCPQPKTFRNTLQSIKFAGGWKDNLKHGQGIMRYSSGNVYSGEWEGDQKQGQGCMRWGEGEVYTGQWAAGLQNGLGQHVWIQPASSGAVQGSNHAFFLMHNRYNPPFLLYSEKAGTNSLLWHLLYTLQGCSQLQPRATSMPKYLYQYVGVMHLLTCWTYTHMQAAAGAGPLQDGHSTGPCRRSKSLTCL